MHGCSHVTVADRVAVCQLSCDRWLGYEFLVRVCPVYEKKKNKPHHTGLSHLHEQINQAYRANAHSLVDEQVFIKPQSFAQSRPYSLSL